MTANGELKDAKFGKICQHLTHYTRAWAAHLANSDVDLVLDRWIGNEFSRQVVDKLAARFEGCEKLRMLGVGSGSGEIDLEMALAISSRLKTRIHNTVVEPAAAQLDLFRQHLASTKKQKTISSNCCLDDIEFKYSQQTIEEYLDDEMNRDVKYHFISAIESMCHMANFGDVIETLRSRLEVEGVLLIQLDSERSTWEVMMDNFPELRETPDIGADTIRKFLDERPIPYEVSRMDVRVDMTRCVPSDPRQLREEDSLILDIITMTPDFASSASQDLYQRVMSLLKSGTCTEKGEDGKIFFRDFRDSLIIQNV